MEPKKQLVFHIFRYQILPTSQLLQMQFDSSISSIDELTKKKNQFFEDSLKELKSFRYSRTELIHKFEDLGNNLFVLKVAANRSLNRSTRQFTEEEIENWPPALIFLNNDPTVQKMAVQFNRKVFFNTNTIAQILENSLNPLLHKHQLSVVFEKLFDKKEFWDLVDKYSNRIVQTDFELVSPNLANISKNLEIDLKRLYKITNTQKTNLKLNSDKDGALDLPKTDPYISSIVDYASQGGGNITLKVRGVKKKIKTKDSVSEVVIDEAELTAASGKDLLKIVRGLLGD